MQEEYNNWILCFVDSLLEQYSPGVDDCAKASKRFHWSLEAEETSWSLMALYPYVCIIIIIIHVICTPSY
jgi:hypothetical protein